MTEQINTVKQKVKTYTAMPFSVENVTCDRAGIKVGDRYRVKDTVKFMHNLGIRENLTKEIFTKPQENWGVIQTALETIEKTKRFGGIFSEDGLVTLTGAVPSEPTQLDYDGRIDQLMNAIEDSGDNQFHGIVFDPDTCKVHIRTVNSSQVDCGIGDIWQFGTTVNLGYNAQEFANFYLRLVCTNGMTTQENLQVRQISAKNIGAQYTRYASSHGFASDIKPRVEKLRNSRASFAEVSAIAKNLTADARKMYMPEYEQIVNDYKERGFDIEKMSAKQKRFVFTNENLYDVFNTGTNLATHRVSEIGGQGRALGLNKACGDIFKNGPNLNVRFLDIYKN